MARLARRVNKEFNMWATLFNSIFQGLSSVFAGSFDPATGYSEYFPGSSYNAITAAFATQGYWAQAGFIYLINEAGFQHFAVLVYLIVLVGGIVSMAMGAPPKMYVWYFMGPALFHFLLGTTVPVYGTAWRVGGVPIDTFEVLKLAETGLKSSKIAQVKGIDVGSFSLPSSTVEVSWVFAEFDGLVSDTIQTFIDWIGVYSIGGDAASSSLTAKLPVSLGGSGPNDSSGRWFLLSNLKWGYLDTIASARLSSPELRDAFITFMAGTCGDIFQKNINQSSYTSAAKSQSGIIPAGIFKTKDSSLAVGLPYTANLASTYSKIEGELFTAVPFPLGIRKLSALSNDPSSYSKAVGSLPFIGAVAGMTLEQIQNVNVVPCTTYLDLLMLGFRWESALLYAQLAQQLPGGVNNPDVLPYAMFYGWDLQKFTNEQMFDKNGSKDIKQLIRNTRGTKLDPSDASKPQQQYLLNLILVNMLKNEFLMAPNAASRNVKFTSTESAANAIEMYQKTVGSRTKFGEIYSWAMMMPYLQGLLLYILAIGYPFACIMIIAPRCGKIMFTWASFWVWAKLWDLGFAIVSILERSVWSTLGNSAKATTMAPLLTQMQDFGATTLNFKVGSTILDSITFTNGAGLTTDIANLALLDRAMTLFSNMDLDLQNSYYIYIMSALYFAVPAVMGQLVLGAKSGIAGMVTQSFQQMAQETGGRAGRALTQQLSRQAEASNQGVDQALYAKNLQNSGLLAKALSTQNSAAKEDLYKSALNANSEGLSNQSQMIAHALGGRKADAAYGFAFTSQLLSSPQNVAPALIALGIEKNAGFADRLLNKAKEMNGASISSFGGSNGASVSGSSIASNGASIVGGKSLPGVAFNAGDSTGGNATGAMSASMGTIHGFGNSIGGAPLSGAPISMNGASVGELRNQFNGAILNGIGSGVEIAGRRTSYQLEREQLQNQAGLTAQRGDISLESFNSSALSQRYQRDAQFLNSEAKGTSQDNAWYQKNAYAQQMAQEFGGLDMTLPQVGPKSTDDNYLARSGLAGADAQVQSHFFSNYLPEHMIGRRDAYEGNRFDNSFENYKNDLEQFGFGSKSLSAIWHSRVTDPISETGIGIKQMSQIVAQEAGKLRSIDFTKPESGVGVIANFLSYSNGGTSTGPAGTAGYVKGGSSSVSTSSYPSSIRVPNDLSSAKIGRR